MIRTITIKPQYPENDADMVDIVDTEESNVIGYCYSVKQFFPLMFRVVYYCFFLVSIEDTDNRGWRVKLYELEPASKGGSWLERGTGYVSMVLAPQISASSQSRDENYIQLQMPNLLVLDEVEMRILLTSPIKYNNSYERQGGDSSTSNRTCLDLTSASNC